MNKKTNSHGTFALLVISGMFMFITWQSVQLKKMRNVAVKNGCAIWILTESWPVPYMKFEWKKE